MQGTRSCRTVKHRLGLMLDAGCWMPDRIPNFESSGISQVSGISLCLRNKPVSATEWVPQATSRTRHGFFRAHREGLEDIPSDVLSSGGLRFRHVRPCGSTDHRCWRVSGSTRSSALLIPKVQVLFHAISGNFRGELADYRAD